jgi:hypothetical protein
MEKEPTAPLIVSVSGLFKNWTWTAGPDWTISGSLSRTFVYTATFTLEDEFGNPYPAQAPTAILRMTVAVQASKTALARQANGFALLAIPLTFIGGGVAVLAGPAAGFILAVAEAFWGLSIWFGARALDPGVPDFRYTQEVTMNVPEFIPIGEHVLSTLPHTAANYVRSPGQNPPRWAKRAFALQDQAEPD